jgi:hypothetical protein
LVRNLLWILFLQSLREGFDRLVNRKIGFELRCVFPRPQSPQCADVELFEYWGKSFGVITVRVCNDDVI